MKRFILLIFALVAICLSYAQIDITIGEGTSLGRDPFADYLTYARSQVIYLQSEIGVPGIINELRWFRGIAGTNNNAIGYTEIWLKQVTYSVFTDATWEDPGTLVASITNINLGGDIDWFTIDIDDYTYSSGNLMVSVYTQDAPFVSPHANWRYTPDGTGIRTRRGSHPSTNPPPMSLSYNRPNIQINLSPMTPPTIPNPVVLMDPYDNAWGFLDGDLSWTSGLGFPATYDVYLDTVNPPVTLVSNNLVGTTYTPTLAANTTYYWKIVPSNAVGPAVGCPVLTFKTPTVNQLAESFESSTFPPPGWANPGNWSRSISYPRHGEYAAYKSGSQYTSYILWGPRITIDGTSTLNFWSASSTTSGILQVVYSPDRVGWTQIGPDISRPSAYTQYESTVDLSSLAGNNYYIGFRTGRVGASYDVDRVFGPDILPEAPGPVTLSTPADLAMNQNPATTFSWTTPILGGIPIGYRVYCDTSPTPTTEVADVTGLTATLTVPLAYNTTYYWTVEVYNAVGNSTTPTPRSFTTWEDQTVTTFPWTAGFDGTVFPPLGWTNTATVGTTIWQRASSSSSPSAAPHSTPYMLRFNCVASPVGYKAELITPPVSIPVGESYNLKFWMFRDSGYPTYNQELVNVYENTVQNSIGATLLGTISRYYGFAPVETIPNQWYEYAFDLPVESARTDRYIIFEVVSQYGNNIYIDDIMLDGISLAPPALTISQTAGVVTLSWDAVPGAISYLVYCADFPDSHIWAELTSIDALTYDYPGFDSTKFFRVVASSESPISRNAATARKFERDALRSEISQSLQIPKINNIKDLDRK